MEDINDFIYSARHDFTKGNLDEKTLPETPYDLFGTWFKQVIEEKFPEPYAMTISTVDKDLQPSSRVVYLRSFDHGGFVFYTNYNSLKGKNLAVSNKVSLLFFWSAFERQIRIHGTMEKISEADSDKYFASRPRESQLGAWASEQSSVIENREVLEKSIAELEVKFKDQPVSRPPHWGGYIIKPNYFEFWQGRKNDWVKKRLAP
jgi:pyridoxamine 5'-phosphate oxidase